MVADVEPEVGCRCPAQHHLVAARGEIATPGDDLHSEGSQIAGLDPNLNEHRIVGVDVLGLHKDADGALHAWRLADAGELVPVDRARQCAGRALLSHREIGLADRDDRGGRLLKAATCDVERHDGHHGNGDGQKQSDGTGLLLPQVAQNEIEECHGNLSAERGVRWMGPSASVLVGRRAQRANPKDVGERESCVVHVVRTQGGPPGPARTGDGPANPGAIHAGSCYWDGEHRLGPLDRTERPFP
jgi:hypothetical protein